MAIMRAFWKFLFLTLAVVFLETHSQDALVPFDGSEVPEQLATKDRYKRNDRDRFFVFQPNETTKYLVGNATEFACSLCSFECIPRCHEDESCTFYGDCCPGVMFGDSLDTPIPASPYVQCETSSWTKLSNFSGAYMVSLCPRDTSLPEDVVRKCEHPDIADQLQATPVAMLDSQISYRNVYCAQCHGVRHGHLGWRHKVNCYNVSELANVKTKEDAWRIIVNSLDSCDIETIAPNEVEVRQCDGGFIEQCNITGKWEEHDDRVEHLCNLYTQTVHYYGSRGKYKVYKNIFCAICNGALLDRFIFCTREKSPEYPHPLSVLLDFNPVQDEPLLESKTVPTKTICDTEEYVYDPLTRICRQIKCNEHSVLEEGSCTLRYSSINGIGFKFRIIMKPESISFNFEPRGFVASYLETLESSLESFKPLLLQQYEVGFFVELITAPVPNGFPPLQIPKSFSEASLVTIEGTIFMSSEQTVPHFVQAFQNFISQNFTYVGQKENWTLISEMKKCDFPKYLPGYVNLGVEQRFQPISNLYPPCRVFDCNDYVTVDLVVLNCSYLDYNMTEFGNITFNQSTGILTLDDVEFKVDESRVSICGDILQLCTDVLEFVEQNLTLGGQNISESSNKGNVTLSIVSLVCICISLVCLVLTFITYSVIPKLRSLPGLNTMALIAHLFIAQLLFLVGSNQSRYPLVCVIMAIAIHFFWLTSFSWMAVSAYHMHSVFAKLRPLTHWSPDDMKRYARYWVIATGLSVLVVVACVFYYLIRSDWEDFGYGGEVCFIREPVGLGIFFAAPLVLMLASNAIFFTLTIVAIRRVPNMTERSNKADKNHFLIYVKLSLLFGFTWVFGILAAIFQSDVLQYTFTILTGSQGLFLFLAYCVNRRTLDMLKTTLKEQSSVKSKSTASTSPSR